MTELNSYRKMIKKDFQIQEISGNPYSIFYEKFGIFVKKEKERQYIVSITGEGTHYSSSWMGLIKHINKRLKYCLTERTK